jgi:polyhydroxyalkanoate synthase
VQAGREDHIAPPQSVWKITHHFKGPLRFVLAGSGHIAGVVNPPEAQKYQYWINEEPVGSLDEFVAGAREIKGSWWPDWLAWTKTHGERTVPATWCAGPGRGCFACAGGCAGELREGALSAPPQVFPSNRRPGLDRAKAPS